MEVPQSFQTQLESRRDAVKALRDKLAALMRQVELAEAELSGWEAAAQSLQQALDATAVPSSRVNGQPSAGAFASLYSGPRVAVGGANGFTDNNASVARRLNGKWKSLVRDIVENLPHIYDLDALNSACERNGYSTTRTTLRSQMSVYANLGIVERVSNGAYRATRAGAVAVGIAFPVSDPTTGGLSTNASNTDLSESSDDAELAMTTQSTQDSA